MNSPQALIRLHTDSFIHTNIQSYVSINAARKNSHLWSFYRLRSINPFFQHNYAKRCKTQTVLVQGELFLLQVQPPSWIEINQSEDSSTKSVSFAVRMSTILDQNQPIRARPQNELSPMQYACPPFWIKINQSEHSRKMSCFLWSTHDRHFGSKSTNQSTAAK